MKRGLRFLGVCLSCSLFVSLAVGFSLLRSNDPVSISRTIANTVEAAVGSSIDIDGPIELHLFPHPTFLAHDVRTRDPSAPVRVVIPSLRATLSLPALLRGRVEVTRLELGDATAVVDADRMFATQRASSPYRAVSNVIEPGRIIITSAVVEVLSSRPMVRGLLTDLDGLATRDSGGGEAKIVARANWHGERFEASGRISSLHDLMAGDPTGASLKMRSATVSLGLNGTLGEGWNGKYTGAVAASTASVPKLLRFLGERPGLANLVERASFSGYGEPGDAGLTFSNARLTLDDTVLVGSLAVQTGPQKLGLAGTLATDSMDLGPVLARLSDRYRPKGRWSAEPLDRDVAGLHDVDLRISASKAALGQVVVEDAAFSILCRGNRLELTLAEARSGDGLVKGRVLASMSPGEATVRIDASVSGFDVDQISPLVLTAPDQISGTATGHVTAEGHGSSVRSIVADIVGHGQISVRQGRLTGLPGLAARPSGGKTEGDRQASPVESRTFDLASASLHLDAGGVDVDNGILSGPDLDLPLRAHLSLLDPTERWISARAGRDVRIAVPSDDGSGLSGSWTSASQTSDNNRVLGDGSSSSPALVP